MPFVAFALKVIMRSPNAVKKETYSLSLSIRIKVSVLFRNLKFGRSIELVHDVSNEYRQRGDILTRDFFEIFCTCIPTA